MDYDIIRYFDFAMFGVGCAFMLITNVLAIKILRPPKKLGFLWWHVMSISLSFLCLGIVALTVAFSRLGEPANWKTPVIFIGFFLFMVAQIIIFMVELQRYAARIAADKEKLEAL